LTEGRPDRTPNPEEYYERAKDAGNSLRAYILSYASGATAVFFLALTGKDMPTFSAAEKSLLVIALLLYVLTALLCLYELHVDARRFFFIAKQLERPAGERESWKPNFTYRRRRLRLIYTSYVMAALATVGVMGFLVLRIF
jgi:hypothetical protein